MIVFDSSILWLIVCMFASLFGAYILYFRKANSLINKKIKIILFLLRALALFFIFSLFLSVTIISKVTTKNKPVVIVAVDNSRSMLASKDSTAVKDFFNNDFQSIVAKLNKTFSVSTLLFGNEIKEETIPDFKQNATDISSFIFYTERLFGKNSVDAAILITDGIITDGFDPVILAENCQYPIYTVATGDTTTINDFAITKIRFNKEVYIKDNCFFEVSIKALGFNNEQLTLQIFDNNKLVSTKTIKVTNHNFHTTQNIIIPAPTSGKHRFTFKILEDKNDLIKNNNEKSCIVNVLDSKRKILLIHSGVHPDINAIKESVYSNDFYTIESVSIDNLDVSTINDNNIVILHGIPSKSPKSQLIINKLSSYKIPYLAVLTSNTDINSFNSLTKDLRIDAFNNNYEEALPTYNASFSDFKIEESDRNMISYYPPLISPFGIYYLPANTDILINQKINNIPTTRPMIITCKDFSSRSAFIFGEGIWAWRIKNYVVDNTHNTFDNLINNIITYLSLSDIFKPYQVFVEDEYFSDDDVTITAKLYNSNHELFNTPDAKIVLKNEDSKVSYPYYFSKSADSDYTLNAGRLSAGNYSWASEAGTETATGAFYITKTNPEYINIQANHKMLRNLSTITKGKFISLEEATNLDGIIKDAINNYKEYSFFVSKKNNELIIFFIIPLLLLSLEWVLRRRHGIY